MTLPYSKILTDTQNKIIEVLAFHKELTRKELVKYTKIARSTLFDNLDKLKKEKLVNNYSKSNGKRGRPLVFWYNTEELI